MKAIITADVHADNNLPFAKLNPISGVTDRLMDCVKIITQLGSIAYENECEQIWIVGDLFGKRLLDGVTLRLVTRFLAVIAEKCEIHLVAGNHEAQDMACRNYNIEWTEEIPGMVAHAVPEMVQLGNGAVVEVCPYMPLDKHAEALKSLEGCDALFTHQSVIGAVNGEHISKGGLPPRLLRKWKKAYLGHYHAHQHVDIENSAFNIMYLGSPWQLNFGETAEKCVWLLDFDNFKIEPIKMEFPEFHTMKVLWQGDGAAVENELKKYKKSDYLRLIVSDGEEHGRAPIKELSKMAFPGRHLKIEYKPTRYDRETTDVTMPASQDVSSYIDGWVDRMCDDQKLRTELKELGRGLCLS